MTDDLLSEMAADSAASPDKLDKLRSDDLDGVSRLANEAAELEQEIASVEKKLKEKKKAQNHRRAVTRSS